MTESSVPQTVESTYRFARVPEWILFHPDLSAGDVRVYGVLDRFDGKECIPSLATVGVKIGCSEDTVRRSARALANVGALSVEPRFADGRQTSNRYVLAGDASLLPRPGNSATPGDGNSATLPPGTVATRSRAIKNESKKNQSAAAADAFDAFWKMYPRKEAKGGARRALDSALKRTDADTIMAALARRVEWWVSQGTPRDKICHPSTWLNQDRWVDEFADVRSISGWTMANVKTALYVWADADPRRDRWLQQTGSDELHREMLRLHQDGQSDERILAALKAVIEYEVSE